MSSSSSLSVDHSISTTSTITASEEVFLEALLAGVKRAKVFLEKKGLEKRRYKQTEIYWEVARPLLNKNSFVDRYLFGLGLLKTQNIPSLEECLEDFQTLESFVHKQEDKYAFWSHSFFLHKTQEINFWEQKAADFIQLEMVIVEVINTLPNSSLTISAKTFRDIVYYSQIVAEK